MANYITYTEAGDLANERLNVEAWDDAVIEDGSSAGEPGSLTYKSVAMATKAIDRLNFIGDKAVETQDNQFPRGTDTVTPDDIKNATFEIALQLLDDKDPDIEGENLAVISQGYANVRSTYDRDVSLPHISAGIVSLTAWRYLSPYLRDPQFIDITRTS